MVTFWFQNGHFLVTLWLQYGIIRIYPLFGYILVTYWRQNGHILVQLWLQYGLFMSIYFLAYFRFGENKKYRAVS